MYAWDVLVWSSEMLVGVWPGHPVTSRACCYQDAGPMLYGVATLVG